MVIQSSWRCIYLKLTLAISSIQILLVPSVTFYKGRGERIWNVHISLQQTFPFICIRSHQVQNVCGKISSVALPLLYLCTQPWSSASIFCCGHSQLHCSISRWSGLCGRGSFFLSSCSPSGGSWASRLHSVCRFNSCKCLFELTWSGNPTGSQHCSHNQSRHPMICYNTFYFKASFPRVVMHHIQYESKPLEKKKIVSLSTHKSKR